MNTRPTLAGALGAVAFGLLGVFNVAIGVYHTVLFTLLGSGSMFSTAYGIPVTAAGMRDPARLLGSDAIEVYSILLGGAGAFTLWATVASLRGRRSGFWLNVFVMGVAQLAVLYGLIVPGRLTGVNAFAGPALYLVAVALGCLGVVRERRRSQA